MPLYCVKDTSLLESAPPRMVEAKNAASAIRFVASKYVAAPLGPMDAAKLAASGVAIESTEAQ